jgi:Zn-dependent protease with chaperone function
VKAKLLKVGNSETVERRFAVLNFMHLVLVLLAIPIISYFIFWIVQDFSYFDARISIFYPIVHFVLFILHSQSLFLLHLQLLKRCREDRIGRYEKNKIIKLCDAMITENFETGQEVPSIYLANHIGNNAFAINSLLMNFIKKFNAIAISKELFEYLNENEIRAIIAHEIAHFKKYIPIVRRIRFIPSILFVLTAYILSAYLTTVLRIPVFILYLACFILVKKIMSWPYNIYKKDDEFLADLYAARKYGKLNMINALIRIYQMDDQDILLNREIAKFVMKSKRLEARDVEKIKATIKGKLNKKIHDEKKMIDQISSLLKKMTFSKPRALSQDDIRKRNKALENYLHKISRLVENKTLDWDEIDHHVKDGKIDDVEYEGLIELLKKNPELQLFRTPNDNIGKMRSKSHPALRERILFIDKNCAAPY